MYLLAHKCPNQGYISEKSKRGSPPHQRSLVSQSTSLPRASIPVFDVIDTKEKRREEKGPASQNREKRISKSAGAKNQIKVHSDI